ncbi:hypothetical protein [Picosynechococcus sp. NKBG15041c]|uniref:hypothetical protein n=1 Tax=Picosynechococcus sp. NKBG15041c TaxID=1407650 RepID=UPI000407A68E|nr:hypothetical protein [Picosynechococcus sp. NKBG15041c]
MSLAASQSWICVHVPEAQYSVYQGGSHADGTFMRVYVPESASQPGKKLNAILYLHGFALCMPSFYEAHLVELVKQGYIVFFPDFQRSFYPNTPPQAPTPPRLSQPHRQRWLAAAMQTQRPAQKTLSTEELQPLFSEVYERNDTGLSRGLSAFRTGELRRVAWALVVIILLLTVCSWFRREYGKNLIHLLSTVGLSLMHAPTEWLTNAIALTEDAWDYLSTQEPYGHWNQESLDTFAFGHSLGGLIALSLPFGLKDSPNNRFFPKQIVTADPAASTEMGIPKFAIWILKLFRSPFTADPILIQDTGQDLKQPVAILHGGSDTLVPPSQWVDPMRGQTASNYEAIASENKAIYFSYSNPENNPPLVAFHNQAVTSTQYYDDALFENFGGVKDGPNAYNTDYVWPGLTKIFMNVATPENLLSHLNTPKFQVEPTPPVKPASNWTKFAWFVGIALLLGVGFWLWKTVG